MSAGIPRHLDLGPDDRLQNAYVPLPFAVRWEGLLAKAMRERRWWVFAAPSQSGKSTANFHFFSEHASKGAEGRIRVAVTTAAQGKRHSVMEGLAQCLGGSRLLRQYPRDIKVVEEMIRAGTELIIVNNSHYMDMPHYSDLLYLDDMFVNTYGVVPPGIVFSGIYEQVGPLCLPRNKNTDQLRNRINDRYKSVPGHSKDEVGKALSLLCAAFAPDVRKAETKASLVHEKLTSPEFDPGKTGTVASKDLYELVRRMKAIHAKASDPSIEAVIEAAYEHLLSGRPKTKTGKIATALAAA